MLGRSACPCRREAGVAVAGEATSSLWPVAVALPPRPPCRFTVHYVTPPAGHGARLRCPRPAYPGEVLLADDPASLAGQPPFTFGRVFTAWELDPVLTVVVIWVTGLYLLGVWRLDERGDRWPLARTVSFVVPGMGGLFFATSSGLGSYDTTLLSVHMVQHMVLSMGVPLFLALGAPITLMLRTLPPRPRR